MAKVPCKFTPGALCGVEFCSPRCAYHIEHGYPRELEEGKGQRVHLRPRVSKGMDIQLFASTKTDAGNCPEDCPTCEQQQYQIYKTCEVTRAFIGEMLEASAEEDKGRGMDLQMFANEPGSRQRVLLTFRNNDNGTEAKAWAKVERDMLGTMTLTNEQFQTIWSKLGGIAHTVTNKRGTKYIPLPMTGRVDRAWRFEVLTMTHTERLIAERQLRVEIAEIDDKPRHTLTDRDTTRWQYLQFKLEELHREAGK